MANDHKNLEVERKIDQREFTRETGVTPDVWHPINVAPIKLKELKDEMASLSEIEKKKRAAEFIEKNKIPEVKSNALSTVASGAILATASGAALESGSPVTIDKAKLVTVGLWHRLESSAEEKGGFAKDLWKEFRDWLTKDIPEEKPKLFEDPMGWFKYTFLGFLKPKKPETSSDGTQTNNPDGAKPPILSIEPNKEELDTAKVILLNKSIATYSYLSPLPPEKKKILVKLLNSKDFMNVTWQDIQKGTLSKAALGELSMGEIQSVFIANDQNPPKLSADIFSKIPKNPTDKILDLLLKTPSSSLISADIFGELSSIAPSDIPEHIKNKFTDTFKIKDGKIEDPVLQDLIKNSGLSIASASILLLAPYSLDPKDKANLGDPKAQEFFEKKLIPFSSQIINSISKTLPNDLQSDIHSALSEGASSKDIFELYLLTKGNPDIKSLDQGQQGLVFMKMWSIVPDASLKGKLQNILLIGAQNPDLYKNMTPELQQFLAHMTMNVGKSVLTHSWSVIENIWYTTGTNNVPASEKVALAALFGVLIFFGLRFRILFSVVKWSMIATIVAAIAPNAFKIIGPESAKFEKDWTDLGKQ